MPGSDYLPQVIITASATIVAALIVGFGAAALKHRWDTRDEQRRWDRERELRRQEDLRDAFSRYSTVRFEIVNAYLLLPIKPSAEELNRNTLLISRFIQTSNQLRLFLDDPHDFAVFTDETSAVTTFFSDHVARVTEVHSGADEPSTSRPDIPSDTAINELAHKLLHSSPNILTATESTEPSPGEHRHWWQRHRPH
jgi:hypothetical protein